jgi:hypothetical protein
MHFQFVRGNQQPGRRPCGGFDLGTHEGYKGEEGLIDYAKNQAQNFPVTESRFSVKEPYQ